MPPGGGGGGGRYPGGGGRYPYFPVAFSFHVPGARPLARHGRPRRAAPTTVRLNGSLCRGSPTWLPAVSAPTGRRSVATGGAARPHGGPTRNPWKVDIPYHLFAPAGRWRFLGRRKDVCARRFLRPLRGGCVETRTLPWVAHRPLCSGRRGTRAVGTIDL